MNCKDYQNARDAAWRILIRFGISELPVRISGGIKEMGIELAPYSKSEAFLAGLGLARLMQETDGLSIQKGGKYYIFYRGDMTPGRIRFTVAHELGHIVLGHLDHATHTTRNHEPRAGDAPIEQAANQFAARLLAPACALWGLDLHTPEEIAQACHISNQAAQFRADRMRVLYDRNKFLTSPLERRLYQQFLPFIKGEVPRQ